MFKEDDESMMLEVSNDLDMFSGKELERTCLEIGIRSRDEHNMSGERIGEIVMVMRGSSIVVESFNGGNNAREWLITMNKVLSRYKDLIGCMYVGYRSFMPVEDGESTIVSWDDGMLEGEVGRYLSVEAMNVLGEYCVVAFPLIKEEGGIMVGVEGMIFRREKVDLVDNTRSLFMEVFSYHLGYGRRGLVN